MLLRNIDMRDAFKEIVHDYPSLKKVTKLKIEDTNTDEREIKRV